MNDKEEEEEEEEDERREAAIALQSDFKPNRTLTPAQISKFQELHRRRLAIKSKSKIKKKQKDETSKSHSKKQNTKRCADADEDSSNTGDENHDDKKEKCATRIVPNQPRKLHWGLDAKERWERKANM